MTLTSPRKTDSAGQCLRHQLEQAGIRVVYRRDRLYVAGPAGTEHLARVILRHPCPESFIDMQCNCQPSTDDTYDQEYLFGGTLTLFTPGRFTREEYRRLVTLRQKHTGGDLV